MWYWWFSTKQRWLHRISKGDTTVLCLVIKIISQIGWWSSHFQALNGCWYSQQNYCKRQKLQIQTLTFTTLAYKTKYMVMQFQTMGHVVWWPVLGQITWYPLTLVKSLHLIWRSGTRRFHLRVPDLQMSCSDLIRLSVCQLNSPNNSHQGDMPHQMQSQNKGPNRPQRLFLSRSRPHIDIQWKLPI